MKYDFIQVGLGLVGSFFSLQLLSHQKTFFVIDSGNFTSRAAGGVVNPILVDKCKLIPNAINLLEALQETRELACNFLNKDYLQPLSLYKRFEENEMMDLWLEKSNELGDYVSNKIYSSDAVEQNLFREEAMLGKVKNTARWMIENFLDDIRAELLQRSSLLNDSFSYENLYYKDGFWQYGDIIAKNIVFTEGYNVLHNPFFSYLPIHLMKGYALIFNKEDEKVQNIYKSKYFLLPFSNSKIYFGGNHQRNSNNFAVDNQFVEDLDNDLSVFNLNAIEREIRVGLRPCVKDFKPVFGEHPQYKNMYILNGVAGRGVLYGSFGAKKLFDFVYKNSPMPKEYDVRRFKI